MYLTLEVVSPQAASLGAQRRRIVGPKGLTIGRVPGNDWVIPDPYVSRQHARISYVNGSFFVESLGRNAIAIGNASNTVAGNQPQPLRNGDHLFIDQYEIIVTTMQGDPPGSSIPSDDPFGVLPAGSGQAAPGGNSARAAQSAGIPDIWDGGLGEDFADTGVLDPMNALGGSRPSQPEPLPPVNWQQTSPMGDHFEPPPVRPPSGGTPFDLLNSDPATPAAAAAIPGGSGIPDNWDRTNLTRIESAPAPRLPPATPTPAPRPAPSPAPAPSRRAPNREAAVARSPTPEPGISRQPARVAPSAKRIEPSWSDQPLAEPPLRPAQRAQFEAPPHAPPPLRSPPSGAPAASDRSGSFRAAGTTSSDADLTGLLRGAGLSDQDMSPEVVRDLGKALRVVVQGVMDVLRARTEIKLQFRLPLTRIQSDENNPLKHCPNVESALHTLLVQRNPAYLTTVQAFEDAFADIRNHQIAMLEGVRVAFESMLECFDPQELQKQFEGGAKRGGRLGFGGGKSKFWDLYVAHFAQLGSDADDTYRRLFGDVFAEAYEKQLERLKTAARDTGKT